MAEEDNYDGWGVLNVQGACFNTLLARGRVAKCHRKGLSSQATDLLPPHMLWSCVRSLPLASLRHPLHYAKGTLLHTAINRSRGGFTCTTWFPGGRFLMASTKGGDIILWDGSSFAFEDLKTLPHCSAGWTRIHWARHHAVLFSGDSSGQVQLTTPSLQPIGMLRTLEGQSVQSLSSSPGDTKLLATTFDEHPVIWDVASLEVDQRLTARSFDATVGDWHSQLALVATGSRTHNVDLWDPREATIVADVAAHKYPVVSVLWVPGNDYHLLSSSKDGTVKVWDIRQFSVPVADLPAAAPARHIALASSDSVEPFLTVPEVVQAAKDSAMQVYGSALSIDPVFHHILAVGDTSGSLSYWNLDHVVRHGCKSPFVRHVACHDLPINKVTFHPSGLAVASSSGDSSVRVWSVSAPGTLGGPISVLEENEAAKIALSKTHNAASLAKKAAPLQQTFCDLEPHPLVDNLDIHPLMTVPGRLQDYYESVVHVESREIS
ncbi:MAG: hypothetical protein KVP17_003465 [Porospora cf. gigantea B]|uniref:uncharacterized protein n=1 Tax=Porospora cf. gigantea B TaxID=2853592 RepID=UPI003571ABCD|nr:MAG: hypothetical protein KVP17_003465 [Porospora cf. gigantea B]